MASVPESKVCSKCTKRKSLDQFNRNSGTKQDGRRPECKVCENATRRSLYEQRDSEKIRERNRDHYAANTGYHRERKREYRRENPEQVESRNREWREKNAGRQSLLSRIWRRLHPDRAKEQRHIRRAREVSAPGSFTAAEWRAMCVFYDYTCLCCGRREPEIKLSPDHVVPLSRGGSNDISNIQPLCVACNNKKKAKTIDYR